MHQQGKVNSVHVWRSVVIARHDCRDGARALHGMQGSAQLLPAKLLRVRCCHSSMVLRANVPWELLPCSC